MLNAKCTKFFSFAFAFSVGLSDPYVKFKMGGRLLHKSRTIHRDLNPVWDEVFVVPVENPFEPVIIKVSSPFNIKLHLKRS